jgi:hypothetical protein
MIKTLRIASIVVVVMAVVLFVCAMVFGVRTDLKVGEFLKQPGAADRFAADKARTSAKDASQTSPLVKQAVDFSKYLNPPPPPPVESPVASAAAAQAAPMAPVSAKFNLVGTSFYADKPELSFALIDEPGEGLHWVKQGDTVGRLTVEKINDGSITLRDGSQTSEMPVPVKEQWRDLVKGASTGQSPTSPKATAADTQRSGEPASESQRITEAAPLPATTMPSLAGRPGNRSRQAGIAALRRQSKMPPPVKNPNSSTRNPEPLPGAITPPVQETAPAPAPSESVASLRRRMLEQAKSSQITPEEAKQMEQLAEQLKKLEETEQQAATGGANTEAPSADANSKK